MILRFLDTFGGGAAVLGSGNKRARPGFFIIAAAFIHEYIEEIFFRKEDLLMKALVDSGFSPDEGPVGALKNEQKKCREAAELMLSAAKAWQAGEEAARLDVGWEASEYTSTLRQHMDRLKNLIFPLLEQNLSPKDEHKIIEGLNLILFEGGMKDEGDKYVRWIESLEDELSEWK